MKSFIDISVCSKNKSNEELCGDNVEYFRTADGVIVVLSDGLGSGVKANILSTLTTKIAITMLKKGASIEDVVDTIAQTLPVCSVRKLAYSTFTIIKINDDGEVYLVDFDNPEVFFLRDGKIMDIDYTVQIINERKIKESRFTLIENDTMVLVSDGVIHAGAGKSLNLGWQWINVATFLENLVTGTTSSQDTTNVLVTVCDELYMHKPGDDMTVVTLKMRKPQEVVLFSGPPTSKNNDSTIVMQLINTTGKKIVCGGTAANIVSRELNAEIQTSFDMYDRSIPPIAKIKGIDLVTEGVLTLQKTVDILTKIKSANNFSFMGKKDGASLLSTLLYENCTHLNLLIGKAINPAHQNPDFPSELSIKLNLILSLKKAMESLDKIVSLEYY